MAHLKNISTICLEIKKSNSRECKSHLLSIFEAFGWQYLGSASKATIIGVNWDQCPATENIFLPKKVRKANYQSSVEEPKAKKIGQIFCPVCSCVYGCVSVIICW